MMVNFALVVIPAKVLLVWRRIANGMTLTGIKKHVSVLEQAGLVATEKVGRVRTCRLGRLPMREEAAWIERYRKRWEERFDALDGIVAELKREERTSESDA